MHNIMSDMTRHKAHVMKYSADVKRMSVCALSVVLYPNSRPPFLHIRPTVKKTVINAIQAKM